MNTFKDEWISIIKSYFGSSIDEIDVNDIIDMYNKRYKESTVTLYNSYKGIYEDYNARELIEKIYKEYIISEHGSFFVKHEVYLAPLVKTFQYLSDTRDIYKGLLKKATAANNIVEMTLYDGTQMEVKTTANTFYGIANNKYSRYSNYDVSSACTIRGRSTISVCALGVESMVANLNIKNPDALFYTIKDNLEEEYRPSVIDILNSINTPNTDDIIKHMVGEDYKNDRYYKVYYNILDKLDDISKKKLYYKGNIYEAMDIPIIAKKIKSILSRIDMSGEPFKNPYNLPDMVRDDLTGLMSDITNMCSGFRWYGAFNKDAGNIRTLTKTMLRKLVILIDTDSNMYYLQEGINKLNNIFPDDTIGKLTPKEIWFGKANIINLLFFDATDYLLKRYTKYINMSDKYGSLLYMKNEFLFDVYELTRARKNYMGRQRLREGVILPKPKPDIKGLQVIKSSFNDIKSKGVKDIIFGDVLVDEPNVINLLEHLDVFEKKITKDLTDVNTMSELQNMHKLKQYEKHYLIDDPGNWRYRAISLWNVVCNPTERIEPPTSFFMSYVNFVGREDEFSKLYPDDYNKITSHMLTEAKNIFVYKIRTSYDDIMGDGRISENNKDLYTAVFGMLNEYFDSILKGVNTFEDLKNIRNEMRRNVKAKLDTLTLKDNVKKKAIGLIPGFGNNLKFEKIDKVGIPVTKPSYIPEWMIKYRGALDVDLLLAPVVPGLGLTIARANDSKNHVQNIVNYYDCKKVYLPDSVTDAEDNELYKNLIKK